MTRPTDAETARVQALIDARTSALARRGEAAAGIGATRPFLVCTCGADRYGLPLADVTQVRAARACTAIPGGPAALFGIVALAGRIVSVLGLAEALGRPGMAVRDAGHLVVLRGGGAPVALAVDRVVGVVDLAAGDPDAPDTVEGAGLGAGAISGYAATGIAPASADAGEAGFVIVDLPRLLRRYCP